MLIESFIKYIRYELNLSAYTVLSYNNDLNQFKAYLTGGVDDFDPISVTVGDIRAWLVYLTVQKDATSTIRRKLQALRAFYKYLQQNGLVVSSPAKEVELAKMKKRLPECVRVSNVDALFSESADEGVFEQVRDRLMLLMFYSTGIRRSELIGLRDADVSDRELKVHGKRDKDRIVPFGEELHSEIEKYRTLRAKTVCPVSEFFFVRKNGEQLYPTLVYRIVHEKLGEVNSGGKCSPHVLRHTFASVMLNNGAQLNSVKELLGHESLAATQVYTHITYRELKTNYEHAHPRAIKKGG